MSQVYSGMHSFAETLPLGIVPNANYESLTNHLKAVWEQSSAEAAAGDATMLQISGGDINPDSLRLLAVPTLMDSTGATTKKCDLRGPPKARRTTGRGSPETKPHYSSNYHMDVGTR